MYPAFINFFNNGNDLNTAISSFSSICSSILQLNNLELDFHIKMSSDIETFSEDEAFKKISAGLYNHIINNYKNDKSCYFIHKEFLAYPVDYLILFTEPLLNDIKKQIKENNIFDVNLNNENEIIDFLQTYIYSLLVYTKILSDQITSLRKTNDILLPIYSILNTEIFRLQHSNAKSYQLQYLDEQDYIKTNVINNTSSINNITTDIIKQYKKNNTSNINIPKKNKSLYNIYKVASRLIKENHFPHYLSNDLIQQLYQYFIIDKYTKDFYYQYTPTNVNINSIAIINKNEIYN